MMPTQMGWGMETIRERRSTGRLKVQREQKAEAREGSGRAVRQEEVTRRHRSEHSCGYRGRRHHQFERKR